MTPATSGALDPPAADASPSSDRGASAPPPATVRMARRTPTVIERTAVPPARIMTVSEKAIDVTRELVKAGLGVFLHDAPWSDLQLGITPDLIETQGEPGR
jgi:hypothetical protein